MVQPSLFTAGRTPRARHASYQAGVKAARRRGPKTVLYLRILASHPTFGLTDHQAYGRMRVTTPIAFSSIQSIRASLMDAGLVKDSGSTAPSPFGNDVTCWTLTAAGRAAVAAMTEAA